MYKNSRKSVQPTLLVSKNNCGSYDVYVLALWVALVWAFNCRRRVISLEAFSKEALAGPLAWPPQVENTEKNC
ncbi:hypothetical protein ACROYT_G008868 [Oculina patagonica]